MYLKRLDLQGFKSFAGRTTFDFGQGITAVVGPNGSGKSNIADALRWVLGEQSSRLLRARKLDDIIFAGSAKRARGDKVEVTLTLDNSDGWLPLDMSEVTVGRRGYRSGESDYMVNKKRVRLREIQTLMATASASQNSYAIIGQGLVESVLNLRPDERRQLIEEAADIQRYRLRIEEAKGRVAGTHENVERVKLLMKEIAPRVGQLERQARRAGDYARLSNELRGALVAYYDHQWHRAEESLTLARAAQDQAKAGFVQSRVALETCQRELTDITSELEGQRGAAAATAAEREGVEQRQRDFEREMAVASERRSILESRAREVRDEIQGLEGELEHARGVVLGEDDARTKLQEEASKAREILEERREEAATLEREFREAQGHAIDAEAKSKRLKAAAGEAKARIRRMEEAGRDLEREAARLDTRRQSLVKQMAELVRVLRGYRDQESDLVAMVAGSAERRGRLEAELAQARSALAKVEGEQHARRGRLDALQTRLGVLEETQKQMGAGDDSGAVELDGALSTVYEVMRVPRGMEEAIAAALAEQLEAFVFERQAEAIAALQSLVSQGGPRTSVLPLDSLKQVYPLNVMKERGVLGVAVNLIKYPPRYEKLMNALLGRTIVVQDAAVAGRMVRRGLGTVVTVDGIVFHSSGHISGGQPRTSRPFVLGYERDVEAIPKEMERIQRSMAISEREAEPLRERLRQAESAQAALGREAEESMDKRVALQDSLGQRQQKLAQMRGEMRGVVGSRGSLQDQQRALVLSAERLAAERAETLEEAKGLEDTALHMERAHKLFNDRRDGLAKAVSEAADGHAAIDGRLRSLAVQREAAKASATRLEGQVTAKAAQARALETEIDSLESTIASSEKGLAEARGEMETLLGGMQPQEGTHHLEARERDLHAQVLSAQNGLFESERVALEADAGVRRWEAEVEHLRIRIAEDGLVQGADGNIVSDSAEIEVPAWLIAAEGGDEGGGLRPISGGAHIDVEAMGREIEGLKGQIRSLGPVNVEALSDYESLRERHDFLARQVGDLEGAEESLQRAIRELTELMRKKFETTFAEVAAGFERNFQTFFGGGHAKLSLTDPRRSMESGVEIEAQPPHKRTQSLSQLSGGEKALTSVSLLFALLQANPAPFCVLDEVDAMLDEANVGRFAAALRSLAERTQFVVITHNRRTIEVADSIYGVSMGADTASRVLSMRLGDIVLN